MECLFDICSSRGDKSAVPNLFMNDTSLLTYLLKVLLNWQKPWACENDLEAL